MDKKIKERTLLIRNVDEYTYQKISEMAEKAGMKRETYLRRLIQNAALSEQVKTVEDKYASLVKTMTEYIQMQGDIIERNLILMEELKENIHV